MSTPLRVLIVEDDESDALLLVLELERGGYEPRYQRVDTAASMAVALGTETWDVIISDYSMPRFNGIEALKLVKEHGLDIPFILVSGKIGEETAVAAMKAGAHDYVMKDNPARLVPAVKREIREAQIRQEYLEAEMARRRSEEQYRDICENALEGIFRSTPEGRFLGVNRALAEMMGFDSPEKLVSTVADIGQYYTEPGRREEFKRLINERGIVCNFEAQVYGKDGRKIWISINARGLCQLEGKSLYYEGFAENITHRKEGEEALHRANRALKTVNACNHALIFATEERAFLNEICRILVEVAGYRLAWIFQARPREAWPGNLLAQAGIAADDPVVNSDGILADFCQSFIAMPPGKICLINELTSEPSSPPWRAAALRLGYAAIICLPLAIEGKTRSHLSIWSEKINAFDQEEMALLKQFTRDVTYGIASLRGTAERQRAEKARQESEERYRGLVECSPDFVGQLDLDLNFLMVNYKAKEMFRYENVGELLGKNFLEIIDPREQAKALESAKRALETGTVKNVEFTFLRKDGTTFFGEISDSLSLDANGIPQALTVVIRDITVRKKAERALEQSYLRSQRMLSGITDSFANAVGTRDPYTAGHQRRVAQLARAIAEEMQMPSDFIEGIEVMGRLHDIGKIAIPAEILSKPGKISDFEYELIKKHPRRGCEILSEIEFPWPVTDAILQHHERLDGSGYPFKLKGEQIILEARILAVADVVEAMASDRPYRPAMGLEMALQEISQNSGVLYDKDVVQPCLNLFSKKKFYWCRTVEFGQA